MSSRSYNTLQAQITEQALNIKTLTTVYGIRQIQYIDQLKKTFSTFMFSKTKVTFSSNTPGQGYITADIIMVLSHLKQQKIRGVKTFNFWHGGKGISPPCSTNPNYMYKSINPI